LRAQPPPAALYLQGVRWFVRLRPQPPSLCLQGECGGASVCDHNRQRSACKECGGASVCDHNRRRSACRKGCGGSSVCELRAAHNRRPAHFLQGVRWWVHLRAQPPSFSLQGVCLCCKEEEAPLQE
jgi:hypothetical protein